MTDRVCYVTSYFDIGRENWTYYKRTFINYFKAFCNMVDMFRNFPEESRDNCELIVFIDDKYYDQVQKKVGDLSYITLIPINELFMENNIPCWKRLEREREIMKSDSFKSLVSHRYMCPETYDPKYTLINHAKIDFVQFAQIISQVEYFCWVDFGYCGDCESIPQYPVDINKMDRDRINYVLLSPLTPSDNDVLSTLINAPEKVGGGFFFGSREKLQEYAELYHDVHKWFQDNNFADDDQHFVIQSISRRPELFKTVCLGGWFKGLVHYQKN
jgi:Bacterial protein of unknown function (HtrL_YibB)